MKFVIGIEPGTRKTSWGVVVPDLPGCFSAGDTIDEAVENAREAIALFCEVLATDGKKIPAPRPLAEHQANPAYKGWVWAIVDAPVERYFGRAEKINITVPGLILERIDLYAKEHNETRSGFLVRAATQLIGFAAPSVAPPRRTTPGSRGQKQATSRPRAR